MKVLRYFIILLATVVCGNLFAQKSQQELNQLMQERNEYYFTFSLNGNDDLKAIAQTISVDRVDGNVVTAYANNKDFACFMKLGYEVTLQTAANAAFADGESRDVGRQQPRRIRLGQLPDLSGIRRHDV